MYRIFLSLLWWLAVIRHCDAFTSSDFHDFHNHWERQPPPPSPPPNNQWQLASQRNEPTIRNNNEVLRTRSLTGSTATNGNNVTNVNVLELMKVGLLRGYAIRHIKMFNDRIYLARYRRSYWFGTRYYAIDNRYFLETRETCAYRMNETERENLKYEENGEPILDVIYQCQRYAQYCCGLDCCQYMDQRWADPETGIPFANGSRQNYFSVAAREIISMLIGAIMISLFSSLLSYMLIK